MANWRAFIRAVHRDTGYAAVGLTMVYAVSGLAVNHVADWDPSFSTEEHELALGHPIPGSNDDAAQAVLAALHLGDAPSDVFRNQDELQITLPRHSIVANLKTGVVHDEEQRPRFLVSAANWLHLNRGKLGWTWFADAYAVALLYLALSGLFMVPGRKGVLGRGGFFVLVGAAFPVVYAWLAS